MGYNMKIVIYWGINLWWGKSIGEIFLGEGMRKLLVCGGSSIILPAGKTLECDGGGARGGRGDKVKRSLCKGLLKKREGLANFLLSGRETSRKGG